MTERRCHFCQEPIEASATVCPHCLKSLIPGRAPEPVRAPERIDRRSSPMPRAAVWMLLAMALVVTIGGLFALSQATLGVGSICIACFLAILARIAQAGYQHAEVLNVLQRER